MLSGSARSIAANISATAAWSSSTAAGLILARMASRLTVSPLLSGALAGRHVHAIPEVDVRDHAHERGEPLLVEVAADLAGADVDELTRAGRQPARADRLLHGHRRVHRARHRERRQGRARLHYRCFHRGPPLARAARPVPVCLSHTGRLGGQSLDPAEARDVTHGRAELVDAGVRGATPTL